MDTYNRKLGDLINFNVPFGGNGEVVGCSHIEMPGLGRGWIVRITSNVPDTYPFTHTITFDAWIT
jgi:hypothetical protein